MHATQSFLRSPLSTAPPCQFHNARHSPSCAMAGFSEEMSHHMTHLSYAAPRSSDVTMRPFWFLLKPPSRMVSPVGPRHYNSHSRSTPALVHLTAAFKHYVADQPRLPSKVTEGSQHKCSSTVHSGAKKLNHDCYSRLLSRPAPSGAM